MNREVRLRSLDGFLTIFTLREVSVGNWELWHTREKIFMPSQLHGWEQSQIFINNNLESQITALTVLRTAFENTGYIFESDEYEGGVSLMVPVPVRTVRLNFTVTNAGAVIADDGRVLTAEPKIPLIEQTERRLLV